MGLLLNGTSQYQESGRGSRWANIGGGHWSVAAWVYCTANRNSAADSAAGIFSSEYRTDLGSKRITIFLGFGRHDNTGYTTQRFLGGFFDATNWRMIGTPAVPNLNQWYHVCCTYEYTPTRYLRMYQNGILVAGPTTPASANAANTSDLLFRIGMGWDISAVRYFPGRIAEVGVWNRVLSAGEVASLYAGVRPYNIRPGEVSQRDVIQCYFPLVNNNQDRGPNAIGVTAVGAPTYGDGPPIGLLDGGVGSGFREAA